MSPDWEKLSQEEKFLEQLGQCLTILEGIAKMDQEVRWKDTAQRTIKRAILLYQDRIDQLKINRNI